MKRIALTLNRYVYDEFTKKELRGYLQQGMFNGSDIYSNGEKTLYKNMFLFSHIFRPSWDFVISEDVVKALDRISELEIRKIKSAKYFNFDCIAEEEHLVKEYIDFDKELKVEKFYEKYELIHYSDHVFYDLRLFQAMSYSGDGTVSLPLTGLECISEIDVDVNNVKEVCTVNAFCCNEVSFFKPDVFALIDKYIDRKYFLVKEVEIDTVPRAKSKEEEMDELIRKMNEEEADNDS